MSRFFLQLTIPNIFQISVFTERKHAKLTPEHHCNFFESRSYFETFPSSES